MNERALIEWIVATTGAQTATRGEHIQRLWSGYGELFRVALGGGPAETVILKHVHPPAAATHPRGWNTPVSHQRKLRSYEIEQRWYQTHARRCDAACRVPRSLGHATLEGGWLLLLEDLDAAGFAERRQELSAGEMDACLAWLAQFHATFVGVAPTGLWQTGTYWHLATRPDELARMRHAALREAAPLIDARLSGCRFRSLVHGDAKVANFCFSADGDAVAAVDFQYVGGGCGIKDVAYFLSSVLDETACEREAAARLDQYFGHLRAALALRAPDTDAAALELEWRALYPLAWADFTRFLVGWSPAHRKLHRYSQRITESVLRSLR